MKERKSLACSLPSVLVRKKDEVLKDDRDHALHASVEAELVSAIAGIMVVPHLTDTSSSKRSDGAIRGPA